MARSITVGIGGAGGRQALAWATEEAELGGAQLVLLHVCAAGSPLARLTGEPPPAAVALVEPALARALTEAQTRLGGQRVTLRVCQGEPPAGLVNASSDARLLVVGAGEGGRTVRRVLRHAHCPVVVVRPAIQPGRSTPLAGHVVIGVDGAPTSQPAMEFAFAYAATHHLPLAAVHVSEASRDDYFYDDTTLSTHFAVEPAVLELLAEETEAWESKSPSVPVRRAVLHGSVVDTLIRAGVGANLLVVGDKRRGVIGRARSGDVPLTVATEAPCPVAVIPLDQSDGDPL